MQRRTAVALLLLFCAPSEAAEAQRPRHFTEAFGEHHDPPEPVLAYTLRVDQTDLSGFAVELRIRNAPDTLRLAMAAHPEYDDSSWRYVEDLRAEGPRGATIAAAGDALWRLTAPGGNSTIRYRIRVPDEGTRAAGWRPFLSPTGGLFGDLHAFMYLPDWTMANASVRLELPEDWSVATGLTRTADPRTFTAASAFVLADSPILAGRLRSWLVRVDGVPHQVAYWPAPDAAAFDTTALVNGLAGLVRGTAALFGRLPYREYVFQLRDRASGALEHLNSVTLGAPSDEMHDGLTGILAEAAHEYFHTWNLMRIRPVEYGDLDYRTPPRSRGLWWSEGATMYYADLLLRRAQLPTYQPTRLEHLAALLSRYYARSGNVRFSPESVSAVSYGVGPSLGDYSASVHLQGELIATLLDLRIRTATGGRRSLDEVMRLMLRRYAGVRGFTSADVEQTVHEVCGCPVRRFFDRNVRGAAALDFGPILAQAGLKAVVSWAPARDGDGRPLPDLRVFVWNPDGDSTPHLIILDPATQWARAGLHTGDRLLAINGSSPADRSGFRSVLTGLKLGDSVTVEVSRRAGRYRTGFVLAGYDRPMVTVEEIAGAATAARAIGRAWMAGEP